MKCLIVIMIMMSSCIPTEYSNEDTFIGSKENFSNKYVFHTGVLENETKNGWQLDAVLHSDSMFVKHNGYVTTMFQIIDYKFFMLDGNKGDTYTIIEIYYEGRK